MKIKRRIKKNSSFNLAPPDENEMIDFVMPNTKKEHKKDDKDEEKSNEI